MSRKTVHLMSTRHPDNTPLKAAEQIRKSAQAVLLVEPADPEPTHLLNLNLYWYTLF